jgi:OmpA family
MGPVISFLKVTLRWLFLSFVMALPAVGGGASSGGGAPVKSSGSGKPVKGEKYVPTIWVDPDGCEHWVFDDGFEGYMSPHLNRDGTPVCRTQQTTCAILNSDQLFATGRYRVSAGNRKRLQEFFAKAPAKSFIISGYTDSRGSEAANLRLSQKRADAVARVARAAGVEITAVRGYGESYAKASNATSSGRAQNRRVEIVCMY